MILPTPEDLKKMRLELSLTQHDLATRAGVSQPLIARIESGDVDPRLSTLRKIFNALMQQKRKSECEEYHAFPGDPYKFR